MWNASRVLCGIAGFLFVVDALGHAVGLTVTSETTVLAVGLAFFAAGHVF